MWDSCQPLDVVAPSLKDPTIRTTQSILWTIVPNIKQSAKISPLAPQPDPPSPTEADLVTKIERNRVDWGLQVNVNWIL